MTVAEIIILIIGAILFTVSFFIPDKDGDKNIAVVDEESARKALESAVSEEMKRIRETIDEASAESINDNKDKMERYMDRLTNEKMMAVNEYSDTVLEQIHKDHQEAVFLYDMIDSKYSQVKSTAAEINQIEKSVRKLSEEIPASAPVAEKEEPKAKKPVVNKPEMPKKEQPKIKAEQPVKEQVTPKVEKPVKEAVITDEEPKIVEMPKKVEVTAELQKPDYTVDFEPLDAPEVIAEPVVETVDVPAMDNGVELMFDSDSNSMNNNDRILALHKEGKSNMAIAKELGLGVGEVKLVIDLFKSY